LFILSKDESTGVVLIGPASESLGASFDLNLVCRLPIPAMLKLGPIASSSIVTNSICLTTISDNNEVEATSSHINDLLSIWDWE
jgi:hypothetical protein